MMLFATGTLLVYPALQFHSYALFLLGMFIVGTGFKFQLVAGKPLMAALGDPKGSEGSDLFIR